MSTLHESILTLVPRLAPGFLKVGGDDLGHYGLSLQACQFRVSYDDLLKVLMIIEELQRCEMTNKRNIAKIYSLLDRILAGLASATCPSCKRRRLLNILQSLS